MYPCIYTSEILNNGNISAVKLRWCYLPVRKVSCIQNRSMKSLARKWNICPKIFIMSKNSMHGTVFISVTHQHFRGEKIILGSNFHIIFTHKNEIFMHGYFIFSSMKMKSTCIFHNFFIHKIFHTGISISIIKHICHVL